MNNIGKFKLLLGEDIIDPVEKLRFFCSIALSPEEWVFTSRLFEDITNQRYLLEEEISKIAPLQREVNKLTCDLVITQAELNTAKQNIRIQLKELEVWREMDESNH